MLTVRSEIGPYRRRIAQLCPVLQFPRSSEHDAAVVTLWRALARGWPRRRPCEVGTSTDLWLRTSA